MKHIFLGLLALGSISAFAETYRYLGDNMKVIAKEDCLVQIEQSADDYYRNSSSFKVALTESQCKQVKIGDRIASVTKDDTKVLEVVISKKSKSGLEQQTILKD